MIVLALLAAVSSGHYVAPGSMEECVVAKAAELASQSTESAEVLVHVAFSRCDDRTNYERRVNTAQALLDGHSGDQRYIAGMVEMKRQRTVDAAMDAIVSARASKP